MYLDELCNISAINGNYEEITIIGNEQNELLTYKARRILDNKMVVIKEIPFNKISIYEKLKGKRNLYVAEIYDVFEYELEDKKIGIVLQEYINGIDLYDYVKTHG